jgi:hypothetical protein
VVAWRSWASARTVFVLFGASFVLASLGAACLDYAGEEMFERCDPRTSPDAGTGSGSGAESVPLEKQPDCGVPVVTGSGSGSGK